MAFATTADLETRLGVTFSTPTEVAKAQAHLDDATAYLQAEIGQLITAGTATYSVRHRGDGPLLLPQRPVTAVTTVRIGGVITTGYTFIDQELHLPQRWSNSQSFGEVAAYMDVTVTFNYGYATIPPDLKAWCCVLAAQGLEAAAGGWLGSPRVQSERIDDYQVTYVTDGSSMSLPPDVLERLRARYGSGAYVTGVGRS